MRGSNQNRHPPAKVRRTPVMGRWRHLPESIPLVVGSLMAAELPCQGRRWLPEPFPQVVGTVMELSSARGWHQRAGRCWQGWGSPVRSSSQDFMTRRSHRDQGT